MSVPVTKRPPIDPTLNLRRSLGYSFDMDDVLSYNWSTPYVALMAMRLMIASWRQLPAGSLPSDDKMLHRLARWGTFRAFMQSRDEILEGWWLASDNKYYNDKVAEQANRSHRAIGKIQRRYFKNHPEDITWPSDNEIHAQQAADDAKAAAASSSTRSPTSGRDDLAHHRIDLDRQPTVPVEIAKTNTPDPTAPIPEIDNDPPSYDPDDTDSIFTTD